MEKNQYESIDAHLGGIQQTSNRSRSTVGRIKNWFRRSKSSHHKSISPSYLADDNKKTTMQQVATIGQRSEERHKKRKTYLGKPQDAMNGFEREIEDDLREFVLFHSILFILLYVCVLFLFRRHS
jgi:hypothetical protein